MSSNSGAASSANNYICDNSNQNVRQHSQQRVVNSHNSQWLPIQSSQSLQSLQSLQSQSSQTSQSQSSQTSQQHIAKWNAANNSSSPELYRNSNRNAMKNSKTTKSSLLNNNNNVNNSKKANISTVNTNELLDRLMQLQDCIKQVKSVISNLEKSEDSVNREQLARLVTILRGMQSEEREQLRILQNSLPSDDHLNSSNNYNASNYDNYYNGSNLSCGDNEQCVDSLNRDLITQTSVAQLMNKLQESQQKLSVLQTEQSRLLQLQKNAENKLQQMTIMKKELENHRPIDSNYVNVNTNSLVNNDSIDSNSMPLMSIKDLNSRLTSLQTALTSGRHNNIEVDVEDTYSDDMNNVNEETEDNIDELLVSKLRNLQMKNYRINDIMRDSVVPQSNGVNDKRYSLPQRLAQNLQNKLQRRYEADGSEEEELRANQLMLPFTNQRNMVTDDHINNIESFNMPTSLANKLRELQEAEARLKQVEDLMKSIEEMETNIKEAESDSSNNDMRKTINENKRKVSRDNNKYRINAENNAFVTQPKHLSHGSNISSTQQKNVIPRNADESNETNFVSQLSQTINMVSNNNAEPRDTNSESFSIVNSNLIRSMRSQYELMLLILENQGSNSDYINNQQLMHLMLMQNYQLMQQQNILLLSLQQQNSLQQPPQSAPLNRNSLLTATNSDIGSQNVPIALNNQVVPGVRANNYWDNFKSYSRQNKLSVTSLANNTSNISTVKGNENLAMTNNQTVPVMNGELINYNSNQSQDINSLSSNSNSATTSAISLRSSFKTANASHGQCVEHSGIEKQQNLPINDVVNRKETMQQLDSNNLNAIFTMLEKLIENDDKCVPKSVTKKKSTNLIMPENDDDCGAVGGVGISNVVTTQSSQEDNTENKCSTIVQPLTSRPQMAGNIVAPLHVPASSGAIRKKPRNQEILELTSKTDNSDKFSLSLAIGSEMIRPLMPAEGRSSEVAVSNVNAPQSVQKAHSLSIRPPTTGAPPYNDYDGASNESSDDDLAEADQTTTEIIVSESETVHDIVLSPPTNSVPALIQDCQRLVNDDHLVIASIEEDEDDDHILASNSNDSGIRLSGDGEQGL